MTKGDWSYKDEESKKSMSGILQHSSNAFHEYDRSQKGSYKKVLGNQKKLYIDGTWLKVDTAGYEAAAERLATAILDHSNVVNYVRYEIYPNASLNSVPAPTCKSRDFMEKYPDGDLITFYELLDKYCDSSKELEYIIGEKARSRRPLTESIELLVDKITEITGIPDVGGYVTTTLELDAFIRNGDRHLNNLAVIKSKEGYELAPIFDNGAGFGAVPYATSPAIEEEIKQCAVGIPHKLFTKLKAKPFSGNYEKQVEACRELYGSRLQIRYGGSLDEAFNEIAEAYKDVDPYIVNRMRSVFIQASNLHQDVFVNEITGPAYKEVGPSLPNNSVDGL